MACKAILYKGQKNQIEFDVTNNHAALDAFLSKQYPSYFSNRLQSINEDIDMEHNLVLDYDDVLESNGSQTELSKEIAEKIKSGELSADKVFVATARTDNEKGTQQKDIADSLGIPVENVQLNVYGQAKADFVKGLEGNSTFIDNDKNNTDAVAKVGGRTILLPTESKRTAEAIQKDIDRLKNIISTSKGEAKIALQEELKVLEDELKGVVKTEPAKSEISDIEAKKADIERRRKETKENPVTEPISYKEAVEEYKSTDLGSNKDAERKKQRVVDEAQTKEGRAFVENQVAQLETNDDGTITVYRSGTMQEGHNPATTDKKTAEVIASERKKQGLSSDIIEVRVQPADISAIIPGIESEVFIKVDAKNKNRISDSTKKPQKTKNQIIKEKESVKIELGEVKQKLLKLNEDFKNGKFPFSEKVYNETKTRQEQKIKNLEWQLTKYDAELAALEKQKVTEPTENVEESVGKEATNLKRQRTKKLKEVQAKIDEKKQKIEELSSKLTPKEESKTEEQYQPITIKDISHEKLTRDNATDYEEDEKEDDYGRSHTYISSLTVEVVNSDGDTVGSLVKLKDEDGTVSWNAEDVDGNQLSDDGYDTQNEAKQAIVNSWNKLKKKEFDRGVKKANKDAEKIYNKRNKKVLQEIAGLNDQIITLERERVSIVEEYDNKIKELTESKIEEVSDIVDAIPNLSKDQKSSLSRVITNIGNNIAKRLGISVADYKKRIRTFKTKTDVTPTITDLLIKTFSTLNTNNLTTLFQPNKDYEYRSQKDPKIAKFNLEKNSNDNWLMKYLADGKLAEELKRLTTKKEVEDRLTEYFNTLGEKIKSSDEFVLEDISDEFIDREIKLLDPTNSGQSIDQEALENWKALKNNKNKDEFVRAKRDEQRSVLLDDYTYLKTNSYPIGLKVLLLENLLYNNPSYNQDTDKFSKGKRDRTTLTIPILLDGLFVSELEKNGAISSQNILNDYLWGAANFKGQKINLKEYKNNIYSEDSDGIWFKFSGEEDLDKFKRMSALSATTEGRWCTGSDSMAKSYLVDRKSDMYIYYDKKNTNNVAVQVAVANNEVYEIGGTLKSQDMSPTEDAVFIKFLDDNKKINGGSLQNYSNYKKAIIKLEKNGWDYDKITYDDKVAILLGKKYYKDKTELLERAKDNLPIEFYEQYYKVDREFIFIGNATTTISSDPDEYSKYKVITGRLYIHSTSTLNALTSVGGGLSISSDATINADNLTSVGGNLYIRSNATLNADNLTSVGGSLYINSNATLNADNLTSVGGGLSINSNATLNALTSVVGYLYIYSNATLTINNKSYSRVTKELKELLRYKTFKQGNKAAIIKSNTTYFIFGKNSDLTSAIHEKTHEYEDVLTSEESSKLEKWSGYKKGTTEFSEAFAKGAERYIYEGYLADDKKLGGIFKKFKQWFKQIITDAINYFGDINQLNDEVKEIYARMLIEDTTKTKGNVQEEVQTKEEVEPKEVKKTSTSFADKIKQRLSDFFVKLAGKSDLIEVGTDKLNEVAVKLGYGEFVEVKDDGNVKTLATPSGKIYGLFIKEDPTTNEPKIYLSDEFKAGTLIEEVKHFQYFLMKIAAENGDESAGRILSQVEKILKPIVDKVIEAQGKVEPTESVIDTDVRPSAESTLFSTRDGKPIGFIYDTDKVARERFDFSKLKQIGKGSDRTVFDLGDGRVLKVAHTARGLAQNIYEGDYYLQGVIPEVYERGLNYVVVDNVPKAKSSDKIPIYDEDGNEIGESTIGEMIRTFSKFGQNKFDRHDSELEEALVKYGFTDITSYNVLWGDFAALRNWGYKDGRAIHTDGGTFGGVDAILTSYRNVKNLSDPEFREIYYKSRELKREYGDKDKYTRFSAEDEEQRNKLLEEVEKDYGINLLSPVYKQQASESDEDYRDRILDEIWAKLTVRGGTDIINANPTLWNKIKDLFVKIQEYFAKSLGLKDQDLSKLSPYELGKQSFNSLMKGEFITSKPIVIEAEKNPVGGYKPAKNVQEIFDRLPEDVKEYFRAAEGWDEKTGVKNIPQRLLKILDDDKVATSTKLAMLGKATSLFKKPWNSDMKKEVVEAFLSNTTTLDEFLEAADEILNSDNYKDLSNVSLNVRTVRGDMIVLEQLYKYFRDNVTNESEDILTKVSLLYAEITSLSGITLNMASPSMSMEDLVGSFTILSHAALTKMFNTSVDGNTLKSQIDELQKRLKLKSDYIETLTTKIKELTVNSKKTHKVEVIASGFVGGNKAVEKAKKNLINIVSGLKGSTQVPRASAIEVSKTELEVIKDKATADGTFMKAPNGKPTNLNEKQWLQVRSKAFKDWFGDWENDPKNASKVVDENGEPLVVYHGSPMINIDEFIIGGTGDVSTYGLRPIGIFFTTNKDIAEIYAKKLLNNQEAKNKLIDELTSRLYNIRNNKEFDTISAEIELIKSGKIYESFLNINNPTTFDAKGGDFQAWLSEFKLDIGYKTAYGYDALDVVAGRNAAATKNNTYDGVVANNIIELSKYGVITKDDQKYIGTSYVIFDSNKVKSATDNVGTFSTTDNRIRFSAEPINEVEVALANLLLTNYINKKGDLLQAKLALQAQLEALKNVEGENVYEKMVAKLPAGYAILEKLDTGETKSDLIKSSVFKEMRAKANREAALNTFTNRLVGTDKIKNIAQRVKNLDFVDSFVKHLAARVLKRAAINITDAVMGIDTTILKNPAAVNEGAEYKIIRKYYKQVEEIKNNLDNSLVDNIEAEKQLKEINKKMKQDLSKYSSFKDTYPSFEFNYQDTPVTGSVIMDDKKTYMYDSKEGVWRDQKDMRPVSDITNDRLTKSYSSKLFTENYLKSTAKALGNYLTDNTNVAAIMKDAYNSFKEGKHDIKTIRKIEDMIYAAYNVDVTGYVALRHMIEDDSVLRDKTLTELLQNVYSKQATADLATELTNRLGIEEYDSMKAADAIKNFISDEISPKLEEELKDFLNNDTKLIREAMRLAIDGKISAMDLLPVVAKKFNLRGWDEGSVHEFETLVEAVKNKNASPLERKKALLELRQFFIDHKNEPLIKYVADGLVSMTYNDLFSIRTFFTAMGSMANTMWSTFQFMVKEFGDVVYTNIFTPDDSNKITFREYGVLVSEVTAGAFTEMMRKGFTESIRALVTGKGSDIFMAEDARLRSNTWYNKAFTDKFNKLTTSTYNSIKSKLIGKYKELNPIITTKNGELVFTEFHPLFNFKELLGIAIRDGAKNPFITVAESLEAKIFDYENIGRELYLKERDKYNEAKRAAAWLRANQDSFISGTLPSTYDVTKSAGKDIANIGAWIMGSTVALGYRSMVLPVIGDALVSTPATYANVAINTYLEMKGKDRVSGDMARTIRTALGFSEKTEEDLKAAFGKPPSLLKMATMMLTHPVDTQTNYIEKKVEIIESNRNQDVWDEARRPVAEATAVAAPRGVAGVIANSISHWFHGIVINQALAVTPDSNKFARIAKPIGATLAMLIERAMFPFVFKVGTNAFNINVRQLPGGYYIMKGITKGFAHFTKDNINNEDWHKGRDGNYHNGKWSIVPSDGLYKLYENKKTKYAESQEQVGDAMTLDEAKAKAFNSNTMVSRGFVDLINPDKNFVGKYTRKGLQIEEMYDLNEVEKTTLASLSLLSLSMLAYALFSMYDWDEDEDGRWKLIRDPEATIVINGHMTNSYYKDKSSANGIAPMSVQWKDNNGKYHTILSLENIMIRGLFYAPISVDDYVRNDEMRAGDEYTAINTGESKLDVALKVANAMVTGSIKLAMNEVLSRNFGESAGWLVDGIRHKSFRSQKDLQDQEKGYYNMIRPFKQMGLGMLGANANRKYISAMSSVGVEDRYKATDRTFQPIADIMYSDYNLPSWGLRKLGVISKEASEQLLANLMFSDYGRYIGEPIFGIKGSFEDNFTKVYHSPRGTRLSQEFVPTGAFRVKNYEATIGDKSDFDKWGEANGIGASYKFMEPNTFITNITTPEQNIKLQKEVENSAPIIAEQLFKNNIGEFNKMINKVEDKVKTIDGIYMGDNTYEKYKLKQKFNETILNKSYEIAVVLGVRKMIKDNPKNISLIEFNNNSNKTLKDAKQREGINFYKDGTFTLDIVSSTSDPKFTSEEFKIIPSVKSPDYTYNLEMAMDFTIDPNKLGELDRNQMQGLLEEKPRVYNVTMEKLGDLLTAKTIYKVNDRKYNIGVVLNSNNELIPVTDIYKELVEKAESKQYKR